MQPVTLSLMFGATAEQLFCAWTDPALASKWLFRDDDTFIERVEMDVAVGGRVLIVARSRDTTIEYCGNYLLVEKPHLLSFTLEAPKLFAGESEVHLEFRQLDGETEFRLQQSGVNAATAEPRWRRIFIELAKVLLVEQIPQPS